MDAPSSTRLIERADALTTNWRPGAAARLGLDYETLHQQHPHLVYCNTRGYEKGRRSDLPGTDQTAAALTGVEWEDGACDAGNPPVWSRSGMGDTGNAMLAAIAITAALYHRERTGQGQAVSTSIVNAQLLEHVLRVDPRGRDPRRLAARRPRPIRAVPLFTACSSAATTAGCSSRRSTPSSRLACAQPSTWGPRSPTTR